MTGTVSDDVLLFDGFRLDRRGGGLFRMDQAGSAIPVALGSRGLDLLALLARHKGEPVSKDEIMTVVWSGRAVEEANLNVQISKLRHILDQGRPHGSCIQTITGYGYRFVADVTAIDRSAPSPRCPTARSVSHDARPALELDPSTITVLLDAEVEAGTARPGTGTATPVRLAYSASRVCNTESEQHIGSMLTRSEGGSFLISKLGATGVIDPDMATALLDLRQGLIGDYGNGAAAMMLIDQVIVAYRDFVRVTGWVANLSVVIEQELFDTDANSQQQCHLNEDLTHAAATEQHLALLRGGLIPLAERCGDVMCEALSALEAFRQTPGDRKAIWLERR